jgi:hypothetical protein
MIQIHPRDFVLAGVESKIHLQLMATQKEYDLTDCEMIEVLLNFVQRHYIKYFIKHEHEEQDAHDSSAD